jgi:hypothetical protein
MGKFRSGGLSLVVAILSLWSVAGCGGGSKAGPPLFPGTISLSPSTNTSILQGSTLIFIASVKTASNTTLNTTITYTSSDTSILNVAPNGVACAGHWDVAFATCTPGASGAVQVTANALGASSSPTNVFVHPPIDNITVTGILLDGIPIQQPCLSQSQTMTVEAHAFSHGTDITASVGPFSWSANNTTVATLTPLVDSAHNFPTNRATATAVTPGVTQITASASNVSSTSFVQPQKFNGADLNFFETCPIQSIVLSLDSAGSGQTSFVTNKGTSETVIAVITDVMGNSSLPNTTGGIVLSKIPLTWTSSQPGAIAAPTACTTSCARATTGPGEASVTASCSPPTCNVGFPQIPAGVLPPFIPQPVYATAAISGVVEGASSSANIVAASTGCEKQPPSTCTSAAYFLSTAKAVVGNGDLLPVAPNSFLFDPPGDKLFMGSDFGAQIINPSNIGSTTSAFTSLGTVTGKVLAASGNGGTAVFSDTIHVPNQTYIVNSSGTSASAAALNISQAVAAAFSPDGLKTFIVGGNNASSLYVYSSLQALQGPIALSGSGNAVAFSSNGAFAYVAESAANSNQANLTAFATCNNQLAATVTLPANPLLMRVLPKSHIDGLDSFGNPIPDGDHILLLDSTGFDIITAEISPPAPQTLCPQGLTFSPAQRIELGQGTLQPVNFFASADGTQLYVVTSDSSTIVVYNFIAGSVIGGIQLTGNATPRSADISTDAGTIVIAGSDGLLHEVSTALGGADMVQLSFPNLPNFLNPFCSITPTAGPCSVNVVRIRP